MEKFDNQVYGLHFKLDKKYCEPLIDGNNRRVICKINDKISLHSAFMPYKGNYYILFNQELQDKLGLEIGDDVYLELTKDESKYGMDFPIELEEMFSQEPQAYDVFETLNPGKQRNLIYIVSKVKNSESRIKKCLAICHHLKESKGELDFKRLNELIKHYNNL